jgi:DNA-binding PadR family transcriptional regulator
MNPLSPSENVPYHAARLLILIGRCGKPQSRSDKLPAIVGRTLLAKLDFFMRYPDYLRRAAERLQKPCSEEDLGVVRAEDVNTVESHMIRYLYGPWDQVYYVVLAYMIGKGLIEPTIASKVDTFRLTPKGKRLLEDLASTPAFSDLIRRANTIYHLFNAYNGSRLKSFIYQEFPEVVNREIGEKI